MPSWVLASLISSLSICDFNNNQKQRRGPGEMAPWVKWLQCRSLDTSERLGVGCMSLTTAGGQRQKLPGLSWQGSLGEMACLRFTERPVSKNRGAVEEVAVISWTPPVPTRPYPNTYTFEGGRGSKGNSLPVCLLSPPRALSECVSLGDPILTLRLILFCSAAWGVWIAWLWAFQSLW